MNVTWIRFAEENYPSVHRMMVDYYRSGEDADTPQEVVDGFIRKLFDMALAGRIDGRLVRADGEDAGFVLWMKDEAGADFSALPGHGTILEIGLRPEFRGCGLGRSMVAYAEAQMRLLGVDGLYVAAYGPAQGFWAKCGYADSGSTGAGGLPLCVKPA